MRFALIDAEKAESTASRLVAGAADPLRRA